MSTWAQYALYNLASLAHAQGTIGESGTYLGCGRQTVGDPLAKIDLPLCLELGPGILDDIYDGIQRPLERILKITQSVGVPRGVHAPNLGRDIALVSTLGRLKVGDIVTDGDIAGRFRDQGVSETH